MLFVGDDWAEDHHDAGIVAGDGRRLARRRLPEGLAGMSQLHALIAGYLPEEWADLAPGEAAGGVKTGTGTGRGPWVQALVAAGYEVFPVNPMSVARYPERHCTSGAKSDAADAHLLAGDRPPGPGSSPPGRRGLAAGRGDQAGRPGPPEPDLGPVPARAAPARGAA